MGVTVFGAVALAALLFTGFALVSLAGALLWTYHRIGSLVRIQAQVETLMLGLDSVQRAQKRAGVQASKDKGKEPPPGSPQDLWSEIEQASGRFPLS